MARAKDIYNPVGHLEVWKVYSGGESVLHYSDHNMIVSGMGVALAHMFASSGTDRISNFQIRWFQVGASGSTPTVATYQLNAPLSSLSQYGTNSDLNLSILSQIKNGSIAAGSVFSKIPFSQIRKVDNNTVQYLLVLGNNSCNNLGFTLSEVGLFVNNPYKLSSPTPILVAYKNFTSLEKSEEFSVVFKWTITF